MPRKKPPRYVKPRLLKNGELSYHFTPPSWSKKPDQHRGPCPVGQEDLGKDREAAIERAETVLLPLWDKWIRGEKTESSDKKKKPVFGTLDWVFYTVYTNDRFYKFRQKDGKPRSTRQQTNDKQGFKTISDFVMADGRRLGDVHTKFIVTTVVDTLYDKLLLNSTKKKKGEERRTTINHAMKSARRAWFVTQRRYPNIMPAKNPFQKMGLFTNEKETVPATLDQLNIYRDKAKELGWNSLATGALIGFEFQVRVQDIYGTFKVEHYRPDDHPDEICLVDEKTNQLTWRSLFHPDTGAPLYAQLMFELDAIKRERIGGFMFVRDQAKKAKKKGQPWPTWPQGPDGDPDLTHCTRIVKDIMVAAGLGNAGITATSFRHGGATEGGNSGLTLREQMSQGRWKSEKTPQRYSHEQDEQAVNAQMKRLAHREKKANRKGAKVLNLSDRPSGGLSDRTG